ncbi:uncharacterized protein ISCGN_016844 [Ixodes scapularis]
MHLERGRTLGEGSSHDSVIETASIWLQRGNVALPAPYDTKCVDYRSFGKHRFYDAYMTQALCMEECRTNVTFDQCGCIMKSYPFRNRLDKVMCDDKLTFGCVHESKLIYDKLCKMMCPNPCEIDKDKLCYRYPRFCNITKDKFPDLRRVLDEDGNLGEIALRPAEILQTTIEDPSLYYYKFILEDTQIKQTYSRLPKYMCYTLNWRGNADMVSFHEFPPLFDFSLFITWKIKRLVPLDRYMADLGFHHVDNLDAGAKPTALLEPNGNYEYSIEQETFTEDDFKRIYLCSAPQNDCFLHRCEKCPKMQSISLQSLHLDEDEEICYALWDAGELVKKGNTPPVESLGSPVGVAEEKLGTGSSATAGKDETEEYVDCLDELSSSGTIANLKLVQDIPLPAAQSLSVNTESQDRLDFHPFMKSSQVEPVLDYGKTARVTANISQNSGADENLLYSCVPCSIDIAVAERTQKVNDSNMSLASCIQREVLLLDTGSTGESTSYNGNICTSLECSQRPYQDRIEKLENQIRKLTDRLQQADAGRITSELVAQRLQRLEKKWQEQERERETLVSLITRCEGLEARLNKLLNAQIEDLNVAPLTNPCNNKGVCPISTLPINRPLTDTLDRKSVENAPDGKPPVVKSSANDTGPKCDSDIAQPAYSEGGRRRQPLPLASDATKQARATNITISEPSTSCRTTTQPIIRPPWGVLREVLIAGDHNVRQFAPAFHGEMTDGQSFEILMNRKATTATVHAMIEDYEKQARRIPRMYIVHVGINDLLLGHQPDAIVEGLENKWGKRQSALTVCSIPEVTTRGREIQAAAMLLNAKLRKMCKKIRAKYVDFTQDLAINAAMKKDGMHYNHEGVRIVTNRLAEIARNFLGDRRKKRINPGSHQNYKHKEQESLTQYADVGPQNIRHKGLKDSQVHDSEPEAPSSYRENWRRHPSRLSLKPGTKGQTDWPRIERSPPQALSHLEKNAPTVGQQPHTEGTPVLSVPAWLHPAQIQEVKGMNLPWVGMPDKLPINMAMYSPVLNSTPYDTKCVDYRSFGKHRFYDAYMTQALCMEECRTNVTFDQCGCIMKSYPFRNRLDEVMCDDKLTCALSICFFSNVSLDDRPKH